MLQPVAVRVLLAAVGAAAFAPVSFGQADLAGDFVFAPADVLRDSMDVAGTWNGSMEVATGDRVEVTVTNTGNGTAFDLTLVVELPAGFSYAAATASGLPGISASQAGTTLTFSIPANTNITAGGDETIGFGLLAGSAVVAGSYSLDWTFGFGTTDGASDGSDLVSGDVVVKRGASVLTVTPLQQSAAVGQQISWDVTIQNTGLGGLFDVEIDEALLAPTNAAGSLAFVSMTETSPGGFGVPGTSRITFPYLGTGESATVSVVADVAGCASIENEVVTTDRTTETLSSVTASVALDLTQPLISVNTSTVTPSFVAAGSFDGDVQNMGLGAASNLVLDSSLEALDVVISNVSVDWSYNPGTGEFTYIASGGMLANGATSQLDFDVSPGDACTGGVSGTVVWLPRYENVCGDPYATPIETSTISGISGAPSVGLGLAVSDDRLEINAPGQFTLTLSWSERDRIATDPLVVSHLLPPDIGGVIVGAPSAGTADCPGCTGGSTITWTIPLSALAASGSETLVVDFTAPGDPCIGGNFRASSASVSATSVISVSGNACALAANAATSFLVTNAPTGPLTQQFNVQNPGDGVWETGFFDDGDGVREDPLGEGEFITYTAIYEFGTPYTGTWLGSTYKDFLGGLASQQYVSGTAMVSIDSGPFQSVTVSPPDGGETGIKVDLAQIEALIGDANVQGHELEITYQTVVNDSFLGGGSSGSFTELVKLTVGSAVGGNGACNMGEFSQGAFVNVARGEALIGASMPSQVDLCETFDVTLSVSNGTPELPSNVLVTFLTGGDYEFLAGQSPVYTGDFLTNPVTFSENLMSGVPTNPTFALDPSVELVNGGTIRFSVRRIATSGTTPTAVQATVEYDDHQTKVAGLRAFSDAGADSPLFVREAQLNLTVTPQQITVTGSTAQWSIDVTNGGSGTAWGAMLVDTLPTGLTPNAALTDAANSATGLSVMVSGQDMSWDLGDLASGAGTTLTLVVDVAGNACSIPQGQNAVSATWGCGGLLSQTAASTDPNFLFPASALQVVHDAAQSGAVLCESTGEILLIVRSTGASHVVDVSLQEDLATATTGLSYVPGSSTYSTDGVGYAAITGAPTVTGAGLVTWDSVNVPELADLAAVGEAGGTSTIYLKFQVAASEVANAGNRSVMAAAAGNQPCGDPVASPGTTFLVPLSEPSLTVDATGQNLTSGAASANNVTGTPGDSVRWTITLDNVGPEATQNSRLRITFPGTAGGTGLLTFPDTSTATITSGQWFTAPDVAASDVDVYLLDTTLGTTCVDNATLTAELTWGCGSVGATAPNNLTGPSQNVDTATLDMEPDFSGDGLRHSIVRLSNARAEIVTTIENAGGEASSLVVDGTLTGYAYDATFTPTVTGGLTLTSVTFPGAPDVEPRFTLSGTLRGGESAVLRYRVVPTTGFDTLSDPTVEPEGVGAGDSPRASNGSILSELDYQNGCGAGASRARTTTINPHVPDIDLFVDVDEVVVKDGEVHVFEFTLQNTGESNSVAENVMFTPTIGPGWTSVTTEVVLPGNGGASGACAGACTELQLGSLNRNQTAIVRVTATANDNGGALTMLGRANGSLHFDDGTDTGNDYSLDERRSAVVGCSIGQTIFATSETFTPETGPLVDVAIGEEVTYRLDGRWFGGEPLANLEFKDTLPSTLGFVSAADVASTMSFDVYGGPTGTTPPSSGDTGEIRFVLADLAGGVGTFQADLVARVLNVGGPSGSVLTNPSGTRFDAFGFTYHSNNAQDGYTGDVGDPDLHAETTVAAQRAELEIVTTIRNVTQGQVTYSTSTMGDAGDILEYRTVVTNIGDEAAFDVVVTEDPASPKLIILDGAGDGIDNDGDGLTDEADEGTFVTGAGGTVVFDGTDNAAFDQMDASDTVTLLYRATARNDVEPTETLSSAASLVAASLDGGTGNQTGTTGTVGSVTGAEELLASDSADFVGDMIDFMKALVTTSENGDASGDVLVGEILQYRVTSILPEGQVTTFRVLDSLPAGLGLVATPAVTYGWTPAPGQPSITPGGLPGSGAPLAVQYDFGTLMVPAGTDLQRTITIDYFAQVENVSTNVSGHALVNRARYAFGATTGSDTQVTVTVREPVVTVTQSVSNGTPTDAGATLTYTVVATSVGDTTARDLDLRFTLPANTSYVPGSTSATSGPAIAEPELVGGVLVWGRTQASPGPQDLDLVTTGGSNVLEYTFEIELEDGVEPDEVVIGGIAIDWTSLDGPTGTSLGGVTAAAAGQTFGERNGAGGVNAHTAATSSSSSVANAYANRVAATGDTLTGGGFRIGDLVTYTIEIDVQEGTTDAFVVEDVLPAGLAFHDVQSIAPTTGNDGFTFTEPAGANAPSLGDTGLLRWTFGSVVNAGDNLTGNDTLTLTYRARVLDTGGVAVTPTTVAVQNGARLTYQDAANLPEALGAVDDPIDVKQPDVAAAVSLASGQAATVGADEPVRYEVTLENTGDAPAYNPVVRVTLPPYLRGATPTTVTATLGGVSVTLAAPSYSPATGVVEWTLADGQVLDVGPAGTLALVFEARTTAGAGAGASIVASVDARTWSSKPSSDTVERRDYGPSGAVTQGIGVLVPTDISKVSSVTGAPVGGEFTYTILVPGTAVDAALYDVFVLDSLPTNYTLVGAVTNETALGTSLVDGSSGQSLSYRFDEVPANAQAQVVLTVRVDNEPANQETANVENIARFTYAGSDGGTQSAEIDVTATGVDVLEPTLTIDKTFERFVIADPIQGLQAGDRVVYRLAITNSGDAPAHDVVIDDLADEELINPLSIAAPDSPGAAATVGTVAGVTTYRWTVPGPIAVASTYSFEVSLELDPTVQPQQVLTNGAAITWTSLPGASVFERTGDDGEGGALDDYAASENAPVSITIGNVMLTKDEDAAGDATYAPGETVEYDLSFTSGRGTVFGVTLRDVLPDGLVLVSTTLSSTDYERPGGGAITFTSAPTAGAVGTLDYVLGDLMSTGPDPTVDVTIVAYVDDVPGNVDGVDLTNVASLIFDDPGNPGSSLTVAAQSSPVVTVAEPDLRVRLDAPASGVLAVVQDFQTRVDNAGSGAGWQPTLVLELPVGMRAYDPLSDTFSVSVSGGRAAALTLGVDYTVTYDGVTGRLLVQLTGSGGYIGADEELVVDWRARVDENAVDGAVLQIVTTLTESFSADTTGGSPDGLRTYTDSFGSGTLGTPNGGMGDDGTDDGEMTGSLPIVTIVKAVDNAVAEAGAPLSYQIVLTNSGTADAEPSDFLDDLDPNLAAGSLANVTVTPPGGTLIVDPGGGVNGTGQIRVDDLVLAAGQSITIAFDCVIRRPLPDGTTIANQASLAVPGFSQPRLSDSANPADNDGIDTGNDPADGDDDDPTITLIGARPVFVVTKSDTDTNGAPLEPGDVITYTITVENAGNETAVQCVLTDAAPGNTTYVPNSTTLNGLVIADVGGGSPLAFGLSIQSPGAAAGILDVDAPCVITFQVSVAAGVQPGTVLVNQATLVGEGVASGPEAPVLSDDPDTTAIGDGTASVTGGAANVDATKVVADLNGGSVSPGDVLVYRIEVSNLGGADAEDVSLVDAIPVGTTYAAGSLRYDADAGGAGAEVSLTDAADADEADFDVTASGTITLTRGLLAGGAAFTLEFRVTVDGGLASGTVITNQGVVSSAGAPDEPTDQDGNPANGDQPTSLVVGSEPVLRVSKLVIDLDGGVVEPGDVLRYVIETRNIGAADATGVVVTDPLPPAGTSYVANSTRRNGLTLADSPGALSPLVAGFALGALEPGERVTLSADVMVLPGETPGTIFSNQAVFSSTNAGSGVSDSNADDASETGNDPGDPNDDDPTVITVGGGGVVAKVGGTVWRDFDHDRVFTPPAGSTGGPGQQFGSLDDLPVDGWTVELLRFGGVVATTHTAPDGSWELVGVPPGHDYVIRFLHPNTGTVFGNPASSYPGANTALGVISGVYLAPGANVVEQNLPLDPSGIVYNAVTRQPVAGAVAVLNGPPGYDPNVHLPVGQQGQVTAADGYYQFDLLAGFPAGDYQLVITPPIGYLPTFPSTILPPTAGPLDPTGMPDPFLVVPNNLAPTGTDPTIYYLEFSLASGDPNVLNNHVALDPILEGSIAITKTTPKQNVVRGDLVPWTLDVRNLLTSPLPPTEVIDTLPPGFKFVAGSGLVDGLPVDPIVNGRTLTWPGIAFLPGQAREIVLITVVGAGVDVGRYVNTALAREPISQSSLSNVATAEIYVVPDPVFDCTDILGKVFDDADGNGYQDAGERGLAGVRIVTARGLVVTTDAFGRYHIACPELAQELRGSNFILKIDERSLPTGYRMTTENPRVVRLTRGKFVEADFGAAASRVLRIDLAEGAFVRAANQPSSPPVSTLQEERAAQAELSGDRDRLSDEWLDVFQLAIDEVEGGTAVLRLGYVAADEPDELVARRLDDAAARFTKLWEAGRNRGALQVEREVLRVAARTDQGARPGGLRASVDGRVIAGDPDSAVGAAADRERRVDLELRAADVRLQADGFDVEPRLNVIAVPAAVELSGRATFAAYANYWNWIDAAEVRIFDGAAGTLGEPLAVLALDAGGRASFSPSSLGAVLPDARELAFVLRVSDAQGRYDETSPKVLRVLPDEAFSVAEPPDAAEFLVGYGESHLARRRIPVRGGAVTVSGRSVPIGARVFVDGRRAPVTEDHEFVLQTIVGEGTQAVSVRIVDADGTALDATRQVVFPKDDWFYVAMGDLTVGGGSTSDNAVLVTGDGQLDDSVYVNGRVAFYLKGKIKGEHLLTVSLDTRDRPLDELLGGLDDTDPRTLLRFIDPDQYYPVYGDDSTTTWDAPTQGRFYVRLERDDYKVLWGSFKTRILDTELAQIDRGLYGLQGQWRDRDETSFGASRTTVDGFAASPESAAAREELRGTGGSLYYLRHRELVLGSERIRIEIRDKDSGIVLSVRPLAAQQDYEIDYLAGRVLLTQPLASTAGDGLTVQNSSFAGNPVYLVARYEFVPQGADLDALSVGGRVSHWLADSVQVGGTVDHQDQVGGDRDLFGVDVTWRKSADTYVKAEFAASEGPGDGELSSLDGGFTYGQAGGALDQGAEGQAFRVEAAVGAEQLGAIGLDGRFTGVVQQRKGGFSATGQSTLGDSTQVSASLVEPLGEGRALRVELDVRDEELRTSQSALDVQYERSFDDGWSASVGLRHDDVDAGVLSGSGARNGRRDDLALRIGYGGLDRIDLYGFGQLTASRTGTRTANNRYGLGAEALLSEHVTVDGEVSGGNGGLGVRGGTKLAITDRTDLYLAYGLDADRSDTGLGAQNGRRNGTLTVGAKHRYTDTLSVFGEERFQHGDGPTGLTHVYGTDYSPNDRWSGGVVVENGQLEEAGERQIERTGVSVNAGYTVEKTRVASALEWREDEANGGTRETWLTRNTLAYQAHEDWRMLANLDLSRSSASGPSVFNADFTELGLGWAYRPVAHERWNALFRYSYHEDLPSPGQVNGFGGQLDFAQRSHVLSADANYDLSRWMTVGGKLGLRESELKATKGPGTWFDSRAMLYGLRADMHVVHGWDALVETRLLDVDAAQDRRLGVLASIWRHLGENGKLGIGYSFADFSDDLTDLDYDHQGWFVNLIGKF